MAVGKMRKRTLTGLIIFSILILSWSCASIGYINPSLGYDVLDPPQVIKDNPLGVTEDGNLIVNPELMQYIKELQLEVRRLRRGLK